MGRASSRFSSAWRTRSGASSSSSTGWTAATAAVRRLAKLLGKGFTCVSPVPPAVLRQLSPEQRAQVRPKPKYDRQWWVSDG
jgi:hypothetical protein